MHKKVFVDCSSANKSYQCRQKLSIASCALKSYRSFDAILRFFLCCLNWTGTLGKKTLILFHWYVLADFASTVPHMVYSMLLLTRGSITSKTSDSCLPPLLEMNWSLSNCLIIKLLFLNNFLVMIVYLAPVSNNTQIL